MRVFAGRLVLASGLNLADLGSRREILLVWRGIVGFDVDTAAFRVTRRSVQHGLGACFEVAGVDRWWGGLFGAVGGGWGERAIAAQARSRFLAALGMTISF